MNARFRVVILGSGGSFQTWQGLGEIGEARELALVVEDELMEVSGLVECLDGIESGGIAGIEGEGI